MVSLVGGFDIGASVANGDADSAMLCVCVRPGLRQTDVGRKKARHG